MFFDTQVSKTYTKAEISLHNKKTDCWIIIKDKVYDVTSYVEEHPGGDAILAHAGDDSTEGFFGPQHATRVFDMIDDFYIGDLDH
ncbi:Cytochrome B5-like protein [Vitis vinifera]|uniref:Cytochrome B5-like protein n=2 Tax=Vitis vinifera TaxID=29760 RepID=A0A438GX54_VITVI|nr:Cytochrome B5-like protein [Vitis vinifera]